jgi:Mg-chelatase subunit ChlD
VPFPQPGWRHPRRDRAEVARWLQDLSAAGGTDPTPAFMQAFQLSPAPDAIFFMTDGLFEEHVVDHVAQMNRQSGREVQINTISFMDTSAEPLMRRIASDSGGRYRHVAGF